MMVAAIFVSLLLAASPSADQAASFAATGEAHLQRAATPGDHQLDEFEGAHKNFDLAYLTAADARHLCRALFAARGGPVHGEFRGRAGAALLGGSAPRRPRPLANGRGRDQAPQLPV
jgi:hypothetical protein